MCGLKGVGRSQSPHQCPVIHKGEGRIFCSMRVQRLGGAAGEDETWIPEKGKKRLKEGVQAGSC